MPIELESPLPPARPARAPRSLTGRGVLLSLALFFGAVFTANGLLAWSALRTLPGPVLANSYDASQSWNERLAAVRAQDERGWRGQVAARAEGEGAQVVFDLADRDGASIGGLAVTARFEHPSDRRQDIQFTLGAKGAGYAGLVAPVHPGQWILGIEARRNGEVVYVTRNRVTLARGRTE